jgi:hypothetical protein
MKRLAIGELALLLGCGLALADTPKSGATVEETIINVFGAALLFCFVWVLGYLPISGVAFVVCSSAIGR